jgi:hypothetical protein
VFNSKHIPCSLQGSCTVATSITTRTVHVQLFRVLYCIHACSSFLTLSHPTLLAPQSHLHHDERVEQDCQGLMAPVSLITVIPARHILLYVRAVWADIVYHQQYKQVEGAGTVYHSVYLGTEPLQGCIRRKKACCDTVALKTCDQMLKPGSSCCSRAT